ncbi:MAG: hypothetical protein H7101_04600 [Deinococcales bacterium]|nr:hypothetical protein [Chitinophagaceae bacterium]
MQQQITILPSHKIDVTKWDDCVAKAAYQNIFMYTWALNALCDNWDGLIVNDYEAVLPLPWRKKWTLKYMHHVPYLAKLSLMAKENITVDSQLIATYLRKRLWFINFDIVNIYLEKWIVKKRCNYYIPLERTYDNLYNHFTKECQKNIKKSISRGCSLVQATSIEKVVKIYDLAYGNLHEKQTNRNYIKIINFAKYALSIGKASIWEVQNIANKETLLAAIVLEDKGRLYYWLAAPTASGRQCRASYFFINELIKMNANSNKILDFEGSDIKEVAHFYQQFAPETEWYYHIKKTIF